MRASIAILTGLVAVMLAVPAWSAPPKGAPHGPPPPSSHGQHDKGHASHAVPWHSLDRDAKRMLEPLKPHWNRMPPRVQRHVRDKARHWENLPPNRRDAIREHIRQWQRMTPAERARTRANMRIYRHLTPRERSRLHDAYKRFKHMPPARQKQLRSQWDRLDPAQKRQWIDNGANGNLPQPDAHPHQDPRPLLHRPP